MGSLGIANASSGSFPFALVDSRAPWGRRIHSVYVGSPSGVGIIRYRVFTSVRSGAPMCRRDHSGSLWFTQSRIGEVHSESLGFIFALLGVVGLIRVRVGSLRRA